MSMTSGKLLWSFLILVVVPPIYGLGSRVLADKTTTGDNTSIKCTPCGQTPPPPPPPSPPPPAPKKPPSSYCPPPPCTGYVPALPSPCSYIYITGPQGNLYPVDPYFNNGAGNLYAGLPVLLSCGLMALLVLW